jgi:hypothetical protein
MELKTLNVQPMPGQVLIEHFDRNRTMRYGDLRLHSPVHKYDFGNTKDHTATSNIMQHSERDGIVRAVADSIKDRRDYDFKTLIHVAVGDRVWFPAHPFQHSQGFTYKGRKLTLMDYRTLVMRERNGGYETLNGYVLAERAERKDTSEVIVSPFKQYHPNIFKVFMRGHQVEYKEEAYEDFKDMKAGDYVLTRFTDFPLLEEEEHKFFSDKTLYIFRTCDVFAKVDLC